MDAVVLVSAHRERGIAQVVHALAQLDAYHVIVGAGDADTYRRAYAAVGEATHIEVRLQSSFDLPCEPHKGAWLHGAVKLLWRAGLPETTVVVFIDADSAPAFYAPALQALVATVSAHPEAALIKGVAPKGGHIAGRSHHIAAIHLGPDLTEKVRQPLSGEVAMRLAVAARLPYGSDFSVEAIHVLAAYNAGLPIITVDLAERVTKSGSEGHIIYQGRQIDAGLHMYSWFYGPTSTIVLPPPRDGVRRPRHRFVLTVSVDSLVGAAPASEAAGRAAIATARQHGIPVWLVSSMPSDRVLPLADSLGCSAVSELFQLHHREDGGDFLSSHLPGARPSADVVTAFEHQGLTALAEPSRRWTASLRGEPAILSHDQHWLVAVDRGHYLLQPRRAQGAAAVIREIVRLEQVREVVHVGYRQADVCVGAAVPEATLCLNGPAVQHIPTLSAVGAEWRHVADAGEGLAEALDLILAR